MNLQGIKPGDIIEARPNGDRFMATVNAVGQQDGIELNEHVRKGELLTHPITHGFGPVRIVKARDIVGHWRASAATRKARSG